MRTTTAATNESASAHVLYHGRIGQLISRLLYLGILAFIIWVPLPLGSNRPWALAIIELSVAALCITWLLGYLSGRLLAPRLDRGHYIILSVWLLWLGWLLLQFIPLPAEWIQTVSPNSSEWRKGITSPHEQGMGTISVLPGATQAHFFESLAYAGLFWLVILLCGVRHRLRGLGWALLLSGLLQAVYGSLMTLSGLEYSFFQFKEFYQGSATGTFVNRNHFAGYMELSLAMGLGLLFAIYGQQHYAGGWRNNLIRSIDAVLSPGLLIRVALVVMFAGLVLSRSRMGNLAFLAALFVCSGTYLALNWRHEKWRILLLMLGFLIIDLWWVAGWFGGEALIERFESTRFETELRAKMLPDLLKIAWLWPITGTGMGSFHVIYPHFQGIDVTGFNLHAHNDYLQFLIEVGVPGTLLLLGIAGLSGMRAILILLRRRKRNARGIAFAALLATAALGIHGIADFNLQIPANAATLVIILASVWCCQTISARQIEKQVNGRGERI